MQPFGTTSGVQESAVNVEVLSSRSAAARSRNRITHPSHRKIHLCHRRQVARAASLLPGQPEVNDAKKQRDDIRAVRATRYWHPTRCV